MLLRLKRLGSQCINQVLAYIMMINYDEVCNAAYNKSFQTTTRQFRAQTQHDFQTGMPAASHKVLYTKNLWVKTDKFNQNIFLHFVFNVV